MGRQVDSTSSASSQSATSSAFPMVADSATVWRSGSCRRSFARVTSRVGPRWASSTRWTSSATTQARSSIHEAPFRMSESTFSEVATTMSFAASQSSVLS